MSDINFLDNKKRFDGQESEGKGDKREEKMIWSRPENDKPIAKGITWLSFLKKKEKDERAGAERKPTIDKNKVKESRREILELIKKHDENLGLKEKGPTFKNWPTRLAESLAARFKKQPGQKKDLIDYQQVFNQEKNQRIKQGLSNHQPVAEKKTGAPQSIRKPQNGFFDKLFKLIKEKAPVLSLPPAKLAEVKFAKKNEEIGAEDARATERPVKGERGKAEIKEKSVEPTRSPFAAGDIPKVLDTNLIKGEIITFFNWRKRIVTLIIATLVPIFLIGLTYSGLWHYQKQGRVRIQAQTKKLNELREKIRQEEAGLKEVAEFQTKLKVVSKIFAQHVYWTNFFRFLENNTIRNVYYNGFAGDTSGDYSLGATALRFGDITEQVNLDLSLLKDIFTE
jgi:hypothetical protein